MKTIDDWRKVENTTGGAINTWEIPGTLQVLRQYSEDCFFRDGIGWSEEFTTMEEAMLYATN